MEVQQWLCKWLPDVLKQTEVLPSSELKICSKCCQGTQSLADNTYSLNNLSKRPPKHYQHKNQTTLFRTALPHPNYLRHTEGRVLSLIRLFATPRTVPCQAPLSMEFSRQEYWSGLPFPSPRNLPDPGIESHLSLSAPLKKSSNLRMVLGAQLCLTLFTSMDYGPPGSSVYGILQARILEWVAIPFTRGPSQSRDRTCVSCVSCIGKCILSHCATWDS